jgi:hypothetical protein
MSSKPWPASSALRKPVPVSRREVQLLRSPLGLGSWAQWEQKSPGRVSGDEREGGPQRACIVLHCVELGSPGSQSALQMGRKAQRSCPRGTREIPPSGVAPAVSIAAPPTRGSSTAGGEEAEDPRRASNKCLSCAGPYKRLRPHLALVAALGITPVDPARGLLYQYQSGVVQCPAEERCRGGRLGAGMGSS